MKKIISLSFIVLYFLLMSLGQEAPLNYEPLKIRKGIMKIVNKIGRLNEIHLEAVYFGGEKTKQYELFEKILKNATDEELIELMTYPKPAVRGYSFWALAKRHYDDLEDVFIKHVNDEELVYQISGCIGGKIRLIDFMSWVVKPQILDLECKKIESVYEIMYKYREVLLKEKN